MLVLQVDMGSASADIIKLSRSPFLGLMLWLKPKGLNKLIDIFTPPDVKAYYAFIEHSVTARTKAEELEAKSGQDSQGVRQDMFHFLYQIVDPETGKRAHSQQELFSEANLLVVAGSDTTSVSLSGFFFYLVRNPHVHARLVNEIRSSFDSVDEIASGPKLSSCKYLRACVDESMRMAPAGPAELSRTILSGGLTIDGEFLPAGVTVGTSLWSDF